MIIWTFSQKSDINGEKSEEEDGRQDGSGPEVTGMSPLGRVLRTGPGLSTECVYFCPPFSFKCKVTKDDCNKSMLRKRLGEKTFYALVVIYNIHATSLKEGWYLAKGHLSYQPTFRILVQNSQYGPPQNTKGE